MSTIPKVVFDGTIVQKRPRGSSSTPAALRTRSYRVLMGLAGYSPARTSIRCSPSWRASTVRTRGIEKHPLPLYEFA